MHKFTDLCYFLLSDITALAKDKVYAQIRLDEMSILEVIFHWHSSDCIRHSSDCIRHIDRMVASHHFCKKIFPWLHNV